MALFTLLLTVGLNYNYCAFLAAAHYNFYTELAYVVDPAKDKHVVEYFKNVLMDRFEVIKRSNVHEGDDFSIVSTTFSGDGEFIFINYLLNGEEKYFTSRYPWKSSTQKIYESTYLSLEKLQHEQN
jgi:hypothetical protein